MSHRDAHSMDKPSSIAEKWGILFVGSAMVAVRIATLRSGLSAPSSLSEALIGQRPRDRQCRASDKSAKNPSRRPLQTLP